MKSHIKSIKKFSPNITFILIIILLLIPLSYYIYSIIQTTTSKNIINKNEVPYISTYYIKPIVSPKEDVIIDFYITDYNHKEYIEADNNYDSSKFTITVKVDGKKDIIKKNIKAGDNSINIGSFSNVGEQKFSILATDEYGRNSHELFNFFLVKDTPTVNEYTMKTKDLSTYNISNDNNKSKVSSTREGLQRFLNDKQSEGYNKVTLLPGTYRIDHEGTIFIPTEFTLDMNGATLKLHEFTGAKALMMELNNTFDSHVINGVIEGDFYDHDYENSPNNSEWVNGISIGGESKYSSFENLVVKDITGYGGSNGIANSPDGTLGYTYVYPTAIGDTFKLGDIDRKTGLYIASKNRTTSDFIDVKEYANIGYLSVSRYLGYQGNPCNTWNLVCNFYDENKDFIESVDGYQYRRVGVPSNASYMKVTILNEDYPTDLSVQLFRIPTHSSFKNVKFENCRAVGLAQAAMKDMLVENCEFINSGQTLAKCAYDAEDGWDMMQDVTFKGLNFHDNPNNDFLTAAGHNFIIEDMVAGDVYFWERTNSYVVRNSKNINKANLGHGSRTRTGYTRFYNNEINAGINIGASEEDNWQMVVKDSKINARAENKLGTGLYLRCDIGSSINKNDTYSTALGAGNFKDSYIHDKEGENHGGVYTNCKIENITGNMHGTFDISNSEINNWNCFAGSYEPTYNFKNSTLNNFQIQFGYWHQGANILIEECTINNEDFLLMLPHYSMKKPITLINNEINSNSEIGMINFYDDRTGNSAGELVKQETIKLQDNIINLPKSPYVITGLTGTGVNNINIVSKANKYKDSNLPLCDPSS